MPELSLYQTEDDEFEVVEAALQKGCELVPDLNYPTQEFKSLVTLEDYKRYRTQTRSFFILSKEFLRSHLEMRQIEKSGKIIYYIFPRSGGPTILFSGGGLFEEAGAKFIRPGSISYYSSYWVGRKTEKAPTELIEVYKFLVRSVKKSSTRIKPGIRVYWLGPSAKKDVQHGAKLVGYQNLNARQLLD